jgi:hypothetical protein
MDDSGDAAHRPRQRVPVPAIVRGTIGDIETPDGQTGGFQAMNETATDQAGGAGYKQHWPVST